MPDKTPKPEAPETAQTDGTAETERPANMFLANMSHELRNPLNAIIGFSEAILHGYAEGARAREYTQDIHQSAVHMLDLVNDILDLSKAEAGKLDLYEEEFDLADVIERCLTMTRPQMTKGVELKAETAAGLRLRGDERMCSQIILNLLSNSAKFTDEGCVTLTAAKSAGGGIEIKVKDTGAGVSPDALDKIWEPFVQDVNPTHRRRRGAGLGLQLVRRFAELHGAETGIESALGEGSCVTVAFPAARTV